MPEPSRISVDFLHRVRFVRDSFADGGACLREAFGPDAATSRAVAFVDSGVAAAWPTLTDRLSAAHRAPGMPALCCVETVQGGEECKHDMAVVERVIDAVREHHIDRRSFVVAIGGGAVLDAVGLGAALAHRGVRHVRFPTTVLTQDDAGMGVKNGINRFGKKNFVGAFAVPWAVICDESFLATLPDLHFRAGFSEAVKIALMRDAAFFDRLERDATRIAARDMDAARVAIRHSADLHLRHIVTGGDPFELLEARPLDFGHWAAHRLESLTEWELTHGEAVGIGIALDCAVSALMGWLPGRQLDRILHTLSALGIPTTHALLADPAALLSGLDDFREHLGGDLTVTLLREIGVAEDVHRVDPALVREAAAHLLAHGR